MDAPRFQNESGGFSDPYEKAKALVPWLADQAKRIDQAGAIPPDVLQKLVEADLFRMSQPANHGGLSLEPEQSWRAVMQVARGCSSSAWVVGLVVANVLMLGKFPEAAQRDVFGGGKPAVVPMLTGGVGSGVVVEPGDAGIFLSGTWHYASGIDCASWVGLLIDVPAHEEMEAGQFVVLVEAEKFSIAHDSWNVLGMRGTGSKNISVNKVFIPHHRFMSWSALQAGNKHPECGNAELIYDYPLNTIFAMSVAAPTLGVAAACVDEFETLVKQRVRRGDKSAQIEDKIAHIQIASARAAVSMAADTLLQDAAYILQACQRPEGATLEDRARVRMRLAKSTEIALAESQKLFRAVGGSILPAGTRMERLFRDIHAMSSHFLLQQDPIGEIYGRLRLGLQLPINARV